MTSAETRINQLIKQTQAFKDKQHEMYELQFKCNRLTSSINNCKTRGITRTEQIAERVVHQKARDALRAELREIKNNRKTDAKYKAHLIDDSGAPCAFKTYVRINAACTQRNLLAARMVRAGARSKHDPTMVVISVRDFFTSQEILKMKK